jgi:S-formylglutathione hydrolase FrmB
LAAAAGRCASRAAGEASFTRVGSPSLPDPVRCLIVPPPSWDRGEKRRYPVLYFLHDGFGNEGTLQRRGVAGELFRRMADGRLPEFFVVAPGAPGSWFSDSHDGSRRWEEFLTGDLIRKIEQRYPVLSDPRARGITGISMGGYGAVKLALRHPGLYGSVSALSGALIPIGWDDLPRYSWIARRTLKRVFGDSREDNSLAANDVWEIILPLRFERPPFSLQLRAGASDVYGLGGVAAQFGTFLCERGLPTTVVIEPGGHDWGYWRQALISIAEWHARQFSYDSP